MKNERYIGLGLLLGILLVFAGCATEPRQAAVPAPKMVPLKLFYDGRDYYTTATPQGEAEAKTGGYHLIRIEGYVFTDPQSGTVPLRQYWGETRHDHMLLGTDPAKFKKNASNRLVRIEGFAYSEPQSDTVPLKRFSLTRGDNFTLATSPSEKEALAKGYVFRHVEAYVNSTPGSSDITAPASTEQSRSSIDRERSFDIPVVPATTEQPRYTTTTPVTQNRDRKIYNWQKRHAEILEYNQTHQPEVVIIGDSLIHYWGGEPAAPFAWAQSAWNKAFVGVTVENLGFGYDRTENVLWRIENGELDGIRPKLIIIYIGTNNRLINTDEEIAAGIEAIYRKVHEKQPEAKILLLGLLPRRDENSLPRPVITERVNFLLQARYRNMLRANNTLSPMKSWLTFFDFSAAFRKADGSVEGTLFQDGVHLNAGGYEILAAGIQGQIATLGNSGITAPKLPPVKNETVSSAQIQNWIAQLADANYSKRKNAIFNLGQHSVAALPALEQALKGETDEDRRWWIQSAIQECQNPLTRDARWANSLGMKFVPVPGTKAMFSVWDTRVEDYRAYANANSNVDLSWQNPGFAQSETHPVVNVSWDEAKAFCAWLTKKEQTEGMIGSNMCYRLPTDAEWSVAVGLDEPSGGTPAEKDGKMSYVYPWGTHWPPPRGAGNYSPKLHVDNFEFTSPVGSFKPNQYGLYDMGGNVWQWCEDNYDAHSGDRVLRGASWSSSAHDYISSSRRADRGPNHRFDYCGFRVVLETKNSQ